MRLQKADAEIEKIISIAGTPGISYTVVQHGQTLHTGHLGYRDVESRLKPDDQTRHSINSMTKAIVGAVAGIVASSGAIDLYAPVKTYLPEFACSDAYLMDKISIIDLLSHRTGIANPTPMWLGSQNALLVGRDQAVRTFATQKAHGSFRATFHYNNWSYEVIGAALERVTGKRLGVLFQEYIFWAVGPDADEHELG